MLKQNGTAVFHFEIAEDTSSVCTAGCKKKFQSDHKDCMTVAMM